MSRKPQPNKRAAPNRRSASNNTGRSKQSDRSTGRLAGVPTWMWIILALIAGYFVAKMMNQPQSEPVAAVVPRPTTVQQPISASNEQAPEAPVKTQTQKADKKAEVKEEKPQTPTYEFYTLLPETEVIAPSATEPLETPVAPAAKAKPAAKPAASEAPSEAATREMAADDAANTTQQPAPTGRFMLQAASFQNIADAERLANRLKDFGLLAKITDVRATGNQIWHRVQVGPYKDQREMRRAQDLMQTQGIEPMLIRLQN